MHDESRKERMKYSEQQKEQWREYVAEYGSIKDAAQYFGVNPGTMQPYVRDALAEYKTKRNALVLQLRSEQKTMKEIAEALGIEDTLVSQICRDNGVGGKIRYGGGGWCEDKEKKTARLDCIRKHNEAKAREQISEIGFDYVSGYTDTDCHVMIRCRDCGCVFDASFVSIRKGLNIECPECREAERKEAERMRKIEQETRRIESMMQTYRKRIEADKQKAKSDAKKIHRCAVCGKPTTRKRCCSDECSRTYANRIHDQNRRARIRDALVDKDIQPAELYRRDNGICYLCGGKCDFSDCMTTEDGYFIVGDLYPTVDHVIPLAAGGKHSWENVRLAHKRCNTLKSDSLIAPAIEI